MELPLLLTVKEVSKVYGIAESTLRKMLMRPDELPFFRIGRKWYVRRLEFDKWLTKDLSHMTVSSA